LEFTMRTLRAIAFLCLAVPAQSQARELSEQERALCRPDVVRYCLFKLGDADALRQCLRDNREKLSTACRGLLKSRGN
jgi:hypothetical protein